jgi:amino-acid N-acetyltransferase
MRVRKAERRDLPEIQSLLEAAELPALGLSPVLANVLVAEVDSKVVGAITLEVSARAGLLRSVAVAPEHRSHGVGRELFRSLIPRAHELSLKELFLVAPTAHGFFAKLGFEPAAEEEVPLAVRESRAFRDHPPESAEVMRLPLR